MGPFWDCFGTIFGPSWALFGCQDGLKGPIWPPKMAPYGARKDSLRSRKPHFQLTPLPKGDPKEASFRDKCYLA